MSNRLWIAAALAAGVASLSGCVVVPTEPAYGYGHHGYRAPPPAVVVVPPPRPRYWGYGYYGNRDRDWHR